MDFLPEELEIVRHIYLSSKLTIIMFIFIEKVRLEYFVDLMI